MFLENVSYFGYIGSISKWFLLISYFDLLLAEVRNYPIGKIISPRMPARQRMRTATPSTQYFMLSIHQTLSWLTSPSPLQQKVKFPFFWTSDPGTQGPNPPEVTFSASTRVLSKSDRLDMLSEVLEPFLYNLSILASLCKHFVSYQNLRVLICSKTPVPKMLFPRKCPKENLQKMWTFLWYYSNLCRKW